MAASLVEIVQGFSSPKVVLVGDFMIDRYIFGSTDRVSPEAPIPVLRFRREEIRLGGAGFVLAGLSTLGARVSAIGVCGNDRAGESLCERISAFGCDSAGLVRCDRPTVEKVRLLGSSEDRTAQQMIRLDIEDTQPVDRATEDRLFNAAQNALDAAAVLCLEDYNKGVLTESLTQRLIALAKSKNIPVLIDPARLSDYGKYLGATLIKLNRPETEKATGLKITDAESCEKAAALLLETLDLHAVVITMNDKGSYLALRDGKRELLASRPRQVADATGAGDMVLAALAMSSASGADWHEAVELANVVGGLEVEKLGCVPITRDEIIADLQSEQRQHAGKERSHDSLMTELATHRRAGRRIVFTNGCFDLVHLGHVKYFQFAKAQGDVLVVGVNTDASNRRLKGEKRPGVNEDDRIGVLEELESIDYLIKFDSDTPLDLIKLVQPDVLVKGADYAKQQVVGWELVEARGGHVALAPLIDGRSTSNVIKRILDAYSAE
ncbi:MAG: bifunctional heptose 7-phosphate kinase/heptose 1-phosphate adenyltransferase [Burkholderiales bacterium]|nr:bifunctional heptose 7-phosphate kinase/heptose 1-phosphate adenyltransferase [Phycisphaerae bacterium]